jgi:hypothetical protein
LYPFYIVNARKPHRKEGVSIVNIIKENRKRVYSLYVVLYLGTENVYLVLSWGIDAPSSPYIKELHGSLIVRA